jgi:RimJ/RimL family protein N-acetyltransferase
MYRYVAVDFDHDSEFILSLLHQCRETIEKHVWEQAVQTILAMEEAVKGGHTQLFKAMVGNTPVGMVQFNVNHAGIIELHGLLLPNERVKGKRALRFIQMAVDFAFNELNAYKVKAHIPALNAPFERLLRHCGFTKQGMLKGEWNGFEGRGNVLCLHRLNPHHMP